MKFWKIKWENIFTLIMVLVFSKLSIEYFMFEEFDLNTYEFMFILTAIATLVIRVCAKQSRLLYLGK